ncbi:uncharacterized protein A4U43_C10F3340 [Asparagus officinalis]|uniref:Major facilitator superfamily (MFS) profile domain-containing protein n=1 Tax=Asparagus officinalis TaxID=4686 RepID=A0A5P1E236_ASPOF|nr:protein NRT1/ PTR FAMILY 7.3-like [Asparagus officinalis]ONK56023.1 uncharacterized protein A4U43_C10F3340 [Asparagus officinalis]
MADSMPVGEQHEQQNIIKLEEDEKHTRDGSINSKGLTAIRGKSGGWRIGILLLVNQLLATLAFFGIGVNLVLFMSRVLQQDNADAANNVSTWTGTAYMFSLVGAFVSDSYWGRYKTCAFFQIIFVTGLVELSLSSYLLLLKPCIPGDDNPQCEPPTHLEILIFYLSIYQIALGNGAYQPSITTFGADQFDEEDPLERHSKIAFFSYFYLANNVGTLFSNTILAYLEDKGEWVLGFWLSSGAALLALVIFLAGTPQFRHFKPRGNPLSRICQVFVAAIKKRKVNMPINGENLYEIEGKNAINGGRKILHTPDFRFLDRAAAITSENHPPRGNQHPPSPWSLCTITQVEEAKCIIRLLPIWLCSIIYSVVYTQMSSVFVEQAAAMKTSISTFNIPPASVSIFEILSVAGCVLLYRLYLVPIFSKVVKGNSTELQRMGIGLVLATITMVAAGIVESQRIKHAVLSCDDCEDTSSLSILWQIPQYVMMGASEVFMYVGQLEFFNCQAPDGLKSFGSALCLASMSAGSYLSSLLITLVMDITGRGDKVGWISDNLNIGHMDRFYFFLAILVAIDLVIFVACAKCYRYISLDGRSEIEHSSERKLEIEL